MKNDTPAPEQQHVRSRRHFLFKSIAVLPAASALTGAALSTPATPPPDNDAAPVVVEQPRFFNAEEWRFLKSAVDRLIPADNEGPGALALNVPAFIDGQMESGFGYATNWYMHAPFNGDAPALFGYQACMPPRELYRAGIAALNAHCRDKFGGKVFAELAAQEQEQLFQELDHGKLTFDQVPAQWFFTFLLQNTKEGYLSDPIHGGNKDMASWKMIGFPGARADFLDFVGPPGAPYPYGPVGIGKRG